MKNFTFNIFREIIYRSHLFASKLEILDFEQFFLIINLLFKYFILTNLLQVKKSDFIV